METIKIQDLPQGVNKKELLEKYIQDDVFHMSFVFGSSFKNAKFLRDTTDTICSMMWLNSKWKTRIVLIVDELNNNAIEYGSHDNDTNTLEIYIKKNTDSFDIRISVLDAGTWERAKVASQMEELRAHRLSKWFEGHDSIRGRGLFMIISNLVDNLYFQDKKPHWLLVGIEKKLTIEQGQK